MNGLYFDDRCVFSFYTCFVSKSKFYTPLIELNESVRMSSQCMEDGLNHRTILTSVLLSPSAFFPNHNKSLNAFSRRSHFYYQTTENVTKNSKIFMENICILFHIITKQCKHLHSTHWVSMKSFANLANNISYWIPHQLYRIKFTTHNGVERNRFDLMGAVIVCGCMRVRSAYLLHMLNETAKRASICLSLSSWSFYSR